MSSARFTAAVQSPPVPEAVIPATELVGESSITVAPAGIYTLTGRGGPPRRELLWVRDLNGDQIGVVS